MSHPGSSRTREFSIPVRGSDGSGPRAAGDKADADRISPDDHTVISDRSPSGRAFGAATHPFELGNLSAGDRLCHFELLEYVGGGGMGAVFRARDTMLDREVAVKVLSRAQGADDETRRRFHVEAQSAARLDHQNIARVYYVGEDQGLNFIVFEFVRGVNIRDLVERNGPLPVSDAVSYTLQIAEALAHASGRQVVHRDIKPSNIIVTADGRAKLVDMGLARLHAPSGNDELTASGVTLGTFDYISPEQARDPRTADVRSDMYSLGCTLYYMLTGRPPFPEGTVLQKLLQHQGDEVPDPRQFNAAVPDEIAEFLRRLLAKDPRRRFDQPAELIAELLMISSRLNLRPVTTGQFWITPDAQRQPWWERHLPWIVPVAVLLLIAVGIEWYPSASLSLPGPGPLTPPSIESNYARQPAAPRGGATSASAKVADVAVDSPLTRQGAGNPIGRQADSTAGTRGTGTSGANRSADGSSATANRASDTGVGSVSPVLTRDVADSFAESPVGRALEDLENPLGLAGLSRNGAAQPIERGASSEPSSTGTSSSGAIAARSDNLTVGPSAPTNATKSTATSIEPADVSAASMVPPFALIGNDGQRRTFSSLRGAVAVAKNNDVIELQFNGTRDEEPLQLTNLKLTIRAGEGYRPVVIFRPLQFGVSGLSRGMIRVTGGRLSLRNIGLVLDIPRQATAEGWTLIEVQQAEYLSLNHCAMTIPNHSNDGSAFHRNVSFFDITAAPRADMNTKAADTMSLHTLEIELQDCIVRGEAVIVRSTDAQPFKFDWENGLAATSEALFSAEGTTVLPPSGEHVQIALRHLTAVVQGGLVRMNATSDRPYLLKTVVSCANSFLVTRGSPLVEQRGPQRMAVLEQQFEWIGDRNFCQGFTTFLQLTDLTTPSMPRALLLPKWQEHFDSGDNLLPLDRMIWKHVPSDDRPMYALRRDDFVLAERPRGSDPFEASDAGEVGVDWRRLPDFSTDASTEAPRESRRESAGETQRDSLDATAPVRGTTGEATRQPFGGSSRESSRSTFGDTPRESFDEEGASDFEP